MAAPPPAPRGAMSLYADLIGGPSNDEKAAAASPAAKPDAPKNPALRFQPIVRRPQPGAKAKPKPKSTPTGLPPSSTPASTGPLPAPPAAAPAPARTSLADWTTGDGDSGGGDDDGYSQKWPQRGGRKRKKKRLDDKQQRAMQARDAYVDWDEIYDPARPTNMEAYLHSDERIAAARDWKRVLHAHRRQQQQTQQQQEQSDGDADGRRRRSGSASTTSSSDDERRPPLQFNQAFAPPPPAAFAPPASYDSATASAADRRSPAPADSERPQPHTHASMPPQPSSGAPAFAPGLVASRPPVRFEAAAAAAAAPEAEPHDREDQEMVDGSDNVGDGLDSAAAAADAQPRSNRPGQAGFAARLMAKYGWTRGSGLGADESGIINPLRHKRVKGAAAVGRIVGGDRRGGSGRAGGGGGDSSGEAISPVIVLRNMVEGMPDLAAEVADGQLVQEIGEECGTQYGRVERVLVDVAGRLVFIKFTEAVSALRAVNALNGRIFNGNAVVPSFYDADKFEQGVYE